MFIILSLFHSQSDSWYVFSDVHNLLLLSSLSNYASSSDSTISHSSCLIWTIHEYSEQHRSNKNSCGILIIILHPLWELIIFLHLFPVLQSIVYLWQDFSTFPKKLVKSFFGIPSVLLWTWLTSSLTSLKNYSKSAGCDFILQKLYWLFIVVSYIHLILFWLLCLVQKSNALRPMPIFLQISSEDLCENDTTFTITFVKMALHLPSSFPLVVRQI